MIILVLIWLSSCVNIIILVEDYLHFLESTLLTNDNLKGPKIDLTSSCLLHILKCQFLRSKTILLEILKINLYDYIYILINLIPSTLSGCFMSIRRRTLLAIAIIIKLLLTTRWIILSEGEKLIFCFVNIGPSSCNFI